VEAAAELVVHAAPCHPLERPIDDGTDLIGRIVVPAVEQEGQGRGVRKLRLAAESAVDRIEDPSDSSLRLAQQRRRGLARQTLVQVSVEHLADRLGLRLDLAAPGTIRVEHAGEDGAEPGLAILALGREIGSPEEHLAVGREERRERPAALAGEGLDRTLVARVHVRPLVPVHLDADEVLVQVRGDGWVFVRLAVHDVAPVAPHGADVEQDRAILLPGGGEGIGSPRIPVNRLMGGRLEIGGGGPIEKVGSHGRKLPRRGGPSVTDGPSWLATCGSVNRRRPRRP
jgi:hypothetical protein